MVKITLKVIFLALGVQEHGRGGAPFLRRFLKIGQFLPARVYFLAVKLGHFWHFVKNRSKNWSTLTVFGIGFKRVKF